MREVCVVSGRGGKNSRSEDGGRYEALIRESVAEDEEKPIAWKPLPEP